MGDRLTAGLGKVREAWADLHVPPAAKQERLRDSRHGLGTDPGIERAAAGAVYWLCRAQDRSVSQDGGVSHHYSLITGWAPSYPETTGYIIPTLVDRADNQRDESLLQRARRMLDWLVTIQSPDGGFSGGMIGSKPVAPVTFDTGQILLGLARGATCFGEPFTTAMHKAAEWLVKTQDTDGCWRKHHWPFAKGAENAYDTHVAWGLLEAARVAGDIRYEEAALKNVQWALTKQNPNGWFRDCCFAGSAQPLTHTIGYALRGILEAFRYSHDPALLRAARRAGEGLLGATYANGFLPGRLNERWAGTVPWACLTGSCQVAHCWIFLFQETGDARFLSAALRANEYVRKTVRVDGPLDIRGAIKGSFPVSGGYCKYQYPNWSAKFFIDSNLLEQAVKMSL